MLESCLVLSFRLLPLRRQAGEAVGLEEAMERGAGETPMDEFARNHQQIV